MDNKNEILQEAINDINEFGFLNDLIQKDFINNVSESQIFEFPLNTFLHLWENSEDKDESQKLIMQHIRILSADYTWARDKIVSLICAFIKNTDGFLSKKEEIIKIEESDFDAEIFKKYKEDFNTIFTVLIEDLCRYENLLNVGFEKIEAFSFVFQNFDELKMHNNKIVDKITELKSNFTNNKF